MVNSYRCMCDNVPHLLERAMTMVSVGDAKSVNKSRQIFNVPELYATNVSRDFSESSDYSRCMGLQHRP